MENTDEILSYLNELIRFRQKEIVQMENAECNKKLLTGYENRTNNILKLIKEVANDKQNSQDMLSAEELEKFKEKYNVAIQRCADFENYKKRMQRQLADTISMANKNILNDLLIVIDDFDRVQDSMKEYESNSVIEGIKLVYNNLIKILNNENCKKIECNVGDKFDVNLHEAISLVIIYFIFV